jgi:hypothetical protein
MEKEDGMRNRRGVRIIPFLVLAAVACGHPEQKVISQYFSAVNSKDEQTLSSFAVVGFDQKVENWTIAETRPESRVAVPLPDAKIPAKLQSYAAEWQAFIQKERDLKKAVAEAKAEVEKEKKTAALSVGDVSDLESLTGELVTKEVVLNLTTKGESKPYVMTLVQYKMQPSSTGQRMQSRWVVRSLKPAA